MKEKTNNISNTFIETTSTEQRKRKKKKMSDEFSNNKVVDINPLKLYKIEVFQSAFDKLSMTIEDSFFF